MDFLERTQFLTQLDAQLLAKCRCDAYVGSGPGGQHRNKNYTGLRPTLLDDPAICASDETERSQLANRRKALAKLRRKVALEYRAALPEDAGYTHLALENPEYPAEMAKLLDALEESGYEHKKAAERLNLTPTRLLKELYRDTELWQRFQSRRRALGLSELKAPRG
ncbi:MAG: hypothetical protein MJ078_07865 [Clostridia bacterium]|nr:hypothetical protein [Clostridia bacterium]